MAFHNGFDDDDDEAERSFLLISPGISTRDFPSGDTKIDSIFSALKGLPDYEYKRHGIINRNPLDKEFNKMTV